MDTFLVFSDVIFFSFHFSQPEEKKQVSAQNMSEEGSIDMIIKGHNTMLSVLSSRSKSLQTVRVMWSSGNTKVRFC